MHLQNIIIVKTDKCTDMTDKHLNIIIFSLTLYLAR